MWGNELEEIQIRLNDPRPMSVLAMGFKPHHCTNITASMPQKMFRMHHIKKEKASTTVIGWWSVGTYEYFCVNTKIYYESINDSSQCWKHERVNVIRSIPLPQCWSTTQSFHWLTFQDRNWVESHGFCCRPRHQGHAIYWKIHGYC